MSKRGTPNGRCKVCQHPQAWFIEVLLARGASLGDAAERFGLNLYAVRRHWMAHVDPARRKLLAQVAKSAPDDETPSVDYLARMRDAAMRTIDALEQTRTKNLMGLAALLRSARDIQLDIARLRGEDGPAAGGRLIAGAVVPSDAAVEQRVLEAVQGDPEACARIARALRDGERPALPRQVADG